MNVERKTVLIQVANERLRDARVLLKQKRYNGAVYLGGYVIECLLKAAICVHLNCDNLPTIYRLHDLVELLDHSGLLLPLRLDQKVSRSFLVVKDWGVAIRYYGRHFQSQEAERFLVAVKEVREWMLRKISP